MPRLFLWLSLFTWDGGYVMEISVQFVVYGKGAFVTKDSIRLILL